MMHTIGKTLGYERLTVTERQRVLVLNRGRFADILGPGQHWINRRNVLAEMHDLEKLRFVSTYASQLLKDRPDIAGTHLTEVRAGEAEMVLVLRDGRPFELLRPEARAVYWTDAGPWAVERIAVEGTGAVPRALADRLAGLGLTQAFTTHEVPEGHIGLLTDDGVRVAVLKPGLHRFWMLARKLVVRLVDLRWRQHEVTGQEILTRDRVTLRVNLTAAFRVIDPERAVDAVRDFDEALHRALQLAFRKTLGALTLDQLLADKIAVDEGAAAHVRREMEAIGIEVGEIALKDVILPGDMREILNRVVAVQKEAEANVIRRREETNATRSLLNTAKVMEDNPLMLRLKELEVLETVAGKVERLTVHNGTAGLMTDLVKLRD